MKPRFKQRVQGNSIIDDIRIALTLKPVIVILSISAVIRMLFHFVLLPNSPSAFGPDEGTYARLADYVSKGLPVEEFPIYGPNLYYSSRSIALPGAFLIRLGLEELTAVRTVASLYGLTSTFILVLCFVAYLNLRNPNNIEFSYSLDKKFIFMLALFAFIPSNFIWSTIGLRESGSQFWLICTFYLILKLAKSTGRSLWKFTALTAIALTLAYGTRPQTALVFGFVALFFSAAILFKFRKIMPLIAILIGIFAGQAFTTTPTTPATPTTPTTPTTPATPATPATPTTPTAASTNNHFKIWSNLASMLKNLESSRNKNSDGAQSRLPKSNCQGASKEFAILFVCNLSELPYRLFAFLFRPLIFFDQGSRTLNFAALENMGWMILIPLSIWLALRKKQNSVNQFINLGLTSYVLVFALFAALYEGNLGTAFRHKSTILWPLIFILMIAPRKFPKSRRGTTTIS